MSHPFLCPHCGKPLTVEQRLVGAEVSCAHCYQTFLAQPPPPARQMRRFACPSCGQAFQAAWPSPTPQVACPHCQQAVRLQAGHEKAQLKEPAPRIITEPPPPEVAPVPSGEAIELPTEDGGTVTVREPVKIIRKGTRTVVLRKLSPEQKQRQRAVKNVVYFIVGAITLIAAMMILRHLAP